MNFTKPIYSKAELLELAAIPSATFNNWRLRGHIPLRHLGINILNLRQHKYSPSVAAYCRLLSLHRGLNRKRYIKCLNEIFDSVVETEEINEHLTIAVSCFGTSADCGVFEHSGLAMQLCPRDTAFIPAGKIIKQYIEDTQCQK